MPKKETAHIVKLLPKTPGVYQMKNEKGEIIYIGKAKNLKNRVSSYFANLKSHSVKTKRMVREIFDIHYIETNSDLDAFLLETNLIKQHRPKYNVLMRDDKFFVYIKITKEDFPRISITRQRKEDGAWYFGPKTSRERVKKTLKLLRKIFPYRDCTLDITELLPGQVKVEHNTRGKLPCLDYHIKTCTGPCAGLQNSTDYHKLILEIQNFLKGEYAPILHKLRSEMMAYAKDKKFEKAAIIRDLLQSVEHLAEKQEVNEAKDMTSKDAISFEFLRGKYFFIVFQIRHGKIIDQESIILDSAEMDETDLVDTAAVLSTFLRFYYDITTELPEEIIVEQEPTELENITNWLREKRGKKVSITTPQVGKKHELLLLAKKNARSFAKQEQIKWLSGGHTDFGLRVDALAKELNISPLNRIECYDISHLGGTNTVGSMVVFEKGKPKPKDYRIFHLRTLEDGEIDDFKSMHEVLLRRLKYLTKFPSEIFSKKLLKKDLDSLTDISKESTIHYGLFAKDKLIGRIHAQKISEKEIYIEKAWGALPFGDDRSLLLFIQEFSDRYPKTHLYIQPENSDKTFWETLGFHLTQNPPESLKNISSLFHRFPTHSKKTDSSLSSTPDLIIIDGGKGQLSSAQKALLECELTIPMVGLAKRKEELFFPGNPISLDLPMDHQGLHLVRHIRDEAHRFAVSHQEKKKGKKTFASQLDSVPGIGSQTRKKLLNTFGSLNGIKEASFKDLANLVGEQKAQALHKHL